MIPPRRAVPYVPPPGPPTRHKRGGLGTVRSGQRLTVKFVAVDSSGAALARADGAWIAVPFGIPGEEAVIEVTKGGRHAEGALRELLRKSTDVVKARCSHFGRCGGCQWQHLALARQRRLKTQLVVERLAAAGVDRRVVAETVGGGPWEYRNQIHAIVAERGGEVVAGFHAVRSAAPLNIDACPIQHPANVAMLEVVRAAVSNLRLPIHDPSTRQGLVRGFVGTASFATGDSLLTLSLTAAPHDPSAIVHALIDRVPGLVGILATIQPRPSPALLGPTLRLLWGRDTVEEDIGGFRVPVGPATDLPANPRALEHLVDAVVHAASLGPRQIACDLTATTPLFVMALAARAEVAIGVVRRGGATAEHRDVAARNGVANALFTTGPGLDLAPLSEGTRRTRRRPDVVVVTAQGTGVPDDAMRSVSEAGVPRVVYLARSIGTAASDLARWRTHGYAITAVHPVDLLPQTSRVHLVVALQRRATALHRADRPVLQFS